MTNENETDQQEVSRDRAVWLSRTSKGVDAVATDRERRYDAMRATRASGTDIHGEHRFAASEGEALREDGWRELLEFMTELDATLLVALDPWELAGDSGTYARRFHQLPKPEHRFVGPRDVVGVTYHSPTGVPHE